MQTRSSVWHCKNVVLNDDSASDTVGQLTYRAGGLAVVETVRLRVDERVIGCWLEVDVEGAVEFSGGSWSLF